MSALLDLSAPRSVQLKDRGRTFTLHCRRVSKEDWSAYFGAFRVTSENTEEGRLGSADYQTAAIVLAERVLTGAEGYNVAGGGALADLPNWQSRIPLTHRVQLAVTLADVGPSAQIDEFVIHPEGEEVLIDAVWSGPEGRMLRYNGLKHIFRTPTAAQHKRYNDAASRSLVVGGSRTGRTIYLGAHTTLIDLYDELIESVEGYDSLGVGRGFVEQMDAMHKFVAAKELFAPTPTASTVDAEPETEGTK